MDQDSSGVELIAPGTVLDAFRISEPPRPDVPKTATDATTDHAISPVIGSTDTIENQLKGNAFVEVVEHLSSGGLGSLWKAKDEFGRMIVVKTIREHARNKPLVRMRFRREMQVAALLSHPSIVTVLHHGTDSEGNDFFSMPMVSGEDLQARIRRGARLDAMLQHFINACEAIAFAHQRGVIHRDIKPHNIMVGDFGETQVIDWGMAKVVGKPSSSAPEFGWLREQFDDSPKIEELIDDMQLTHGTRPGTLQYMSPEQLVSDGNAESEQGCDEESSGGPIGPWTDVYGLGATLYQILTHRAPFAGIPKEHVAEAVFAGRFPKPRELDRRIDAGLQSIALKAMSREPSDRYETVAELRNDVVAWLRDRPVLAHPDSLVRKSVRWIRRHQVLSVIAVALLSCAVIVLELERRNVREENKRLLNLAASQQESAELRHRADDRIGAWRRAVDAEALRRRVYKRDPTAANHLNWIRSTGRLAVLTHKSGPKHSTPDREQKIPELYRITFEELDRFEARNGKSVESEWLRINTLGDRGMSDVSLQTIDYAIDTYEEAIRRLNHLQREATVSTRLEQIKRGAEPETLNFAMELGRLEGNLADAHSIASRQAVESGDDPRLAIENEVRARCRSVDACLVLPDELLEDSVVRVQIVRLAYRLARTDRETEAVQRLKAVLKRIDTIEQVEEFIPQQQVYAAHCFALLARHEPNPHRGSAYEGRAIQAIKQSIRAFERHVPYSDPGVTFDSLQEIPNLAGREDFEELLTRIRMLGSQVTET
ncbi:MAG: serine/threonine-protein kinase [Planctomycetota bacterium]